MREMKKRGDISHVKGRIALKAWVGPQINLFRLMSENAKPWNENKRKIKLYFPVRIPRNLQQLWNWRLMRLF